MSYHKNPGGDKQLKGANGWNHLGRLLSEAVWSQILSEEQEEKAPRALGTKAEMKSTCLPWVCGSPYALEHTRTLKVAEPACLLPATVPCSHPSPEHSRSAATTGEGCATGTTEVWQLRKVAVRHQF